MAVLVKKDTNKQPLMPLVESKVLPLKLFGVYLCLTVAMTPIYRHTNTFDVYMLYILRVLSHRPAVYPEEHGGSRVSKSKPTVA